MFKKISLLSLILALIMTGASSQVALAQGDKLILSPCKFDVGQGQAKHQIDATCGTLQVPENRSQPDSKKINLAVVVIPAAQQANKDLPIFHFEGGPGGSAISNFGMTWYSSYHDLMQTHDIVLIDQRGIGKSTSLQCTEETSVALDDLSKAMTSDDDTKAGVERLKACLKRVSAITDPANYTTAALADDTDAVRQALGYDQINVFGNSYGTWLGQIYLGKYGKNIYAIVLDSVVGPWNNFVLDSAANTENSLDKVIALCDADTQCKTAYPDLKKKLETTLLSLKSKPASSSGISSLTGQFHPVVMTDDRLLDAIRQTLYLDANLGTIPQLIDQAASGNYTLAASTLVSEAELSDQISLGLYYSVICAENVAFFTDDLLAKFPKGKYFGADDKSADQLKQICGIWRSGEVSKADVAPVKSDRPVLILSGAFDPVTPISYGEEAKSRYSHSTLAVFPYEGHGPMAFNRCAQNMVAAFFNAPDKPVDTSCTANNVKPLFSGAYTVQFQNYRDPAGKFTTNIPQGWSMTKEEGVMTFFSSPDGSQVIGVAVVPTMSSDQAKKAAFDAIGKVYGPVEVQVELDTFGSVIIQHAITTPNDVKIGVLTILAIPGQTRVVWHAAPVNVFNATFTAIVTNLLFSLH